MNQADVKVSFYLKKSEADAKGNCPVMARLNVGKYSEAAFSVKMSVPHTMWLSDICRIGFSVLRLAAR